MFQVGINLKSNKKNILIGWAVRVSVQGRVGQCHHCMWKEQLTCKAHTTVSIVIAPAGIDTANIERGHVEPDYLPLRLH